MCGKFVVYFKACFLPMTPTKIVIVALTGTRILLSLLVSELDFHGTSLTWPGPMDFFRFCKNRIIKTSYTMPIAKAKTTFISWNMGINDNSFSIVNPAQDEAPDGIPKYNDAKYPNKLEYNFGQIRAYLSNSPTNIMINIPTNWV